MRGYTKYFMNKLLLVYNSETGKKHAWVNLSGIIERLSAADYEVTILPMSKGMDASKTISVRAAEFDRIVCCGGNETLNEAVTGLMRSKVHRPVGFIPIAALNNFKVSPGVSPNVERSVDAVISGTPLQYDIGVVNEKEYFLCSASFGQAPGVFLRTNKHASDQIPYITEGSMRFDAHNSYSIRVISDTFNGNGDFIYGMVSIPNSMIGIDEVPDKKLDDGVFEVSLVRTPLNWKEWLQTIIGGGLSDKRKSENVLRFETRFLEISSERPIPWLCDGEIVREYHRMKLDLVPHALEALKGV